MPVRNCCLGCQGSMCSPCGGCSGRTDEGVGPCCVHSCWANCNSPCGDRGIIHGSHGGCAGSYFSCGHGCIGIALCVFPVDIPKVKGFKYYFFFQDPIGVYK